VKIARSDLDPGIGYADYGPGKILVFKTHRLEHRPRRRPIRPVGNDTATFLEILCHDLLLGINLINLP